MNGWRQAFFPRQVFLWTANHRNNNDKFYRSRKSLTWPSWYCYYLNDLSPSKRTDYWGITSTLPTSRKFSHCAYLLFVIHAFGYQNITRAKPPSAQTPNKQNNNPNYILIRPPSFRINFIEQSSSIKWHRRNKHRQLCKSMPESRTWTGTRPRQCQVALPSPQVRHRKRRTTKPSWLFLLHKP